MTFREQRALAVHEDSSRAQRPFTKGGQRLSKVSACNFERNNPAQQSRQ